MQARQAIERYRAHIGAVDPSATPPSHIGKQDDWGTRALAILPRWRVGQTTGRYATSDGMGDSIVSGADPGGLHERLQRFLVDRKLLPPWMTPQESTKHVELKVAFMARMSGTDHVRLVVNKPRGAGPE